MTVPLVAIELPIQAVEQGSVAAQSRKWHRGRGIDSANFRLEMKTVERCLNMNNMICQGSSG